MARDFDGTDDKLLDTSGAVLSGVPGTIAAWIMPNSIETIEAAGVSNSSEVLPLYRIGTNASRRSFVSYRPDAGGTTNNATGTTFLPTTSFSHVCGTFASNAHTEVFANGVSEATGTAITDTTITLNQTEIGCFPGNGSFSQFFKGPIAEVAFWNVQLTDAEIVMLALGVSPLLVRPQNLVSYEPLIREIIDLLGAASFAVTGTTVAVHPEKVIRPSAQILQFPAAGGSAALTGTMISGGVLESEIVAGGETVIITLTGDTWAAAGTGPIGSTADTQALIDGFDAATSPTNGWNNEVRDKEPTSIVTRDSDTQATLLFTTAAAAYDIASNETITVTIPAAVLVTSGSDFTATPTFDVTNETAGRIMSSLAYRGGLAGMGGIAGIGGGLAS